MKKKSITIPLFVVILIIALIAGGIYIAIHFLTDMGKSDKQMFLKYISENMEVSKILELNEIKEYAERQKTVAYSNEGNIKANIITSNVADDDSISALQNSSITFTGNVDRANKYFYQNINANYSDTQALNFEVYRNDDIYAIKINEVLKSFIGIQNKNLKEFAKKMGVPDEQLEYIPDVIDFTSYNYTPLFTDAEKETLKKKYTEIIMQYITDDMFTNEKTDDSKIYTLTITQQKAKEILNAVLDELKNDSIIIGKIDNFLIEDCKIPQDEVETLKEKLTSSISIEDADEAMQNEDLKIRAIVKNKKLEQTEFVLGEYKVAINNINTENDNSLMISLLQNEVETFIFKYKITKVQDGVLYEISAKEKNTEIAKIKIQLSGLSTNQVQEQADFSLNFDETLLSTQPVIMDSIETGTAISYTYNNIKKFGSEASSNRVSEGQTGLINNVVKNSNQLENLLTQIMTRFVTLNNQKMQAAGISTNNTNPFIYYSFAPVPIGITASVADIGDFSAIKEQAFSTIKNVVALGIQIFYSTSELLTSMNSDYPAMTNSGDGYGLTDNSSSLSGQEVMLFNNMYEIYSGNNRTATDVRAIFNAVISNNTRQTTNGNTDRIIKINNQIPSTVPNINSNVTYSIKNTYDSNGYIIGITIKPN